MPRRKGPFWTPITPVAGSLLRADQQVADLAQLSAWRDVLMAARCQGIRTVEYDGKRAPMPATPRWRRRCAT